jgi:uncharacterized membrane protein
MTIVLIGLLVFLIGIQPDLIGMNRSQAVGFVQIGVWLVGLAILLTAAYSTVRVIRNGKSNSLRADIGVRLIATGFVIAGVASLADFISVGAHRMPLVIFGPVQVMGLILGVFLCIVGLVLYWPRRAKGKSPPEGDVDQKDREPKGSDEDMSSPNLEDNAHPRIT